MRTGKVRINKVEYTLCLSTRVMINIQKRYGCEFQEALGTILGENDVEKMFLLIADMIEAGARYEEMNGNSGKRISFDGIVDSVSPLEYQELFSSLTEAISEGSKTNIETEVESKNANPTQD